MKISALDMQRGIVVIGGGTAGYLAALTLRVFHPELKVALVDSSKIPIIGVGEATTSEIIPFLHSVLSFEPREFYEKVLPTWKLGIKFFWGKPEIASFNYPFDRGPLFESLLYEHDSGNATLNSALMTFDLSPILMSGDSGTSLLPKLPFAYHLDNGRFVRYLREKAIERGIQSMDREIVDVGLSANGERISHLITSDGQVLEYDFYVDCTGFRSLLLEQKLRSEFLSYKSSLFTDSAVVANVPQQGVMKPYTSALTMNSGWCWNIPQRNEDHLGYVFASDYCSPDEALAELRKQEPDIRDIRWIKFRSGRHRHFVKGNVAAIGNSYGFVEPLESTGIFVICRECLLLAQNLNSGGLDASIQVQMNARIAHIWDYIRWFLAVHYRFNKRRATPFWTECQSSVDITGAAEIIAGFKGGAPLSYRQAPASDDAGHNLDPASFGHGHNYDARALGHGHNIDAGVFDHGHNFHLRGPGGGHNFDAFGYDVMLFGQGVEAEYLPQRRSQAEYDAHVHQVKMVLRDAVCQNTALKMVADDHPEFLTEALREPSWIPSLAESMLSSCGLAPGESNSAPDLGDHKVAAWAANNFPIESQPPGEIAT